MRGWFQETLQRAVWSERTEEKPVGVIEDVAVALVVAAAPSARGPRTPARASARDGRKDEKPALGKRLAEERGYVPRVPHPPRKDENEGRRSLQEDVEDFPFERTLKAAHHAHPFVTHPRRPVETPHHRLRRHPPRRKKAYLLAIQKSFISEHHTLQNDVMSEDTLNQRRYGRFCQWRIGHCQVDIHRCAARKSKILGNQRTSLQY